MDELRYDEYHILFFLYINKIIQNIYQSCCSTVYACELNICEILCDKVLLK